jgi:2-polyprenyl-6-methoxyphenol hydroxylase-like FAD-dependent oxidoreductase
VIALDVLVVGGGPAGLASALVLARQGLQVMICEKSALPAEKACGEGIMPTGLALLRGWGIDLRAGTPFSGIHYSLANCSESAEATFAEGPGMTMRRTELSEALLQRCRQESNLRVRQQTRVRLLERTPEGVCVQIGEESALARLVVGADGLHSSVRTWAGLRSGSSGGSGQRWGLRQHYAIEPWSDKVQVILGQGQEAYVWPSGTSEIGVSVLYRPGKHRGPHGMAELLQQFPALWRRLKGGRPTSRPRGSGPLRQNVRSVEASGVVLVGDASGYLDACTGEGISLALAQAEALGRLVPRSMGGRGLVHTVAGYRREHAHIMRSYKIMTSLSLLASHNGFMQRRLLQILASDPGLFTSMLSANMGTLSLSGLGLRLLRHFFP